MKTAFLAMQQNSKPLAFKGGKRELMKSMYNHAKLNGYAIPKFNATDHTTVNALAKAAKETESPIVIEFSESAIKYIDKIAGGAGDLIKGVKKTLAIFRHAPKNELIFSHVDHGKVDLNLRKKLGEFISEWGKHGGDSFMFDGTKLTKAKNVDMSEIAVKRAKAYRMFTEVEMDALPGGASHNPGKIIKTIFTTPETATMFAKRVKADSFAPNVGLPHGSSKKIEGIKIEPEQLVGIGKAIEKATGEPPILIGHGASSVFDDVVKKFNNNAAKPLKEGQGTSNEITQSLIKKGMSGLNVDTDGRQAGLGAMMEAFSVGPKVDLRPIGKAKFDAIYEMAVRKLKQFGSLGKKDEILAFHKERMAK